MKKINPQLMNQQILILLKKLSFPIIILLIGIIGQMLISLILLPSSSSNILYWHHFIDVLLNTLTIGASFCLIFMFIKIITNYLQNYSINHKKKILLLILPVVSSLLKIMTLLYFFYSLTIYLNFPKNYELIVGNILKITLIIGVATTLIKMIVGYENIFLELWAQNATIKNTAVRQFYTQAHILRQILVSVILIISIALTLMVFDTVRQIGVGILASAGVVSAIIGFSAQKVLSNMMTCLQIAFSQIIKIGDEVIIDNLYGEIEEISLTYIVLKVWDLQRYIIPIHYLNEKSIKNLSHHKGEGLIGTVFIGVDYTFSVEKGREAFLQLLHHSTHWDRKKSALDVTDAQKNKMEIRLTMSARNFGTLWVLQCEMREKMIAYILKTYPNSILHQSSKLDFLREN